MAGHDVVESELGKASVLVERTLNEPSADWGFKKRGRIKQLYTGTVMMNVTPAWLAG